MVPTPGTRSLMASTTSPGLGPRPACVSGRSVSDSTCLRAKRPALFQSHLQPAEQQHAAIRGSDLKCTTPVHHARQRGGWPRPRVVDRRGHSPWSHSLYVPFHLHVRELLLQNAKRRETRSVSDEREWLWQQRQSKGHAYTQNAGKLQRTSTASARAMKLSTSLGSYSTSTWWRDTEQG